MPKNPRSTSLQANYPTETRVERIMDYLAQYPIHIAILTSIALTGIVATVLWQRHQQRQNISAQNELFQAIYQFEAGNFEKALQGDESYAGLVDIIQEYGFTKTANLAHLYAGIACMNQQNYPKATEHLKKFKATDFLLQARAWSLLGDAFSEQKSYSQAITYYLKAAAYKPNEFFTPTYLVKAALCHEATKNYQAAAECYQRISNDYPKSSLYEEACKHASRLAKLS